MAIATVSNFIFILHKLKNQRYADAATDITVLTILSYLFGGTMAGMAIAIVASAIMSIYLWFFPPNFDFEELVPRTVA